MFIRCRKCGQLLSLDPETIDETEVEAAIMVDGEAYCEECLEDARATANTVIETLLKNLSPLEKAGLARFNGVDWGDLYTEYIEEYER